MTIYQFLNNCKFGQDTFQVRIIDMNKHGLNNQKWTHKSMNYYLIIFYENHLTV